jgi:hypothetical protein
MEETWYRWTWRNELEEVTVIKETAKQVVYLEYNTWSKKTSQRRAMKGNDFFKTKEEAIKYKRDHLTKTKEYAENNLTRTINALEKFNIKYSE